MEPPKVSTDAVLVCSENLPDGHGGEVKGFDFNNGINYEALLNSYATTGFQATNFAAAVEEINRMLKCKKELIPETEKCEINLNPHGRDNENCTIFLSFTSNIISSGVRETIKFLVQHNLVDVLVTSAGGIEEDFIKCLQPCYIGDFNKWEGAELRSMAINRIGNLLAPNSNYVAFESWLMPILAQLMKEQTEQGIRWTPSKLIHRLGKEIDNPDSVYYWCYKNNIPVFCPGLTDGSLGDILYFNSYKNPDFLIDIIEDIRLINCTAAYSRHTGVIILGGGIAKHHTCNANLMHNGADFAVFINTASEFDGSDSGARPDEAKSWGKIRPNAAAVKIYADATLVFPLIVAQTFARYIFGQKKE